MADPNLGNVQNISWEEMKTEITSRLKEDSNVIATHRANGGQADMAFVGDLIKSPYSGKFKMNPREGNYGDKQTIQRGKFGNKEATLQDLTLVVALNDFEQILTKSQVYADNMKNIVSAVDEAKDMIVINKIAGVNYQAEAEQFVSGKVFGDPVTGLDFGMNAIKELKTHFDKNKVPKQGRILFITHDQHSKLLQDEQYINNDYLKQEVLRTGEIQNVLGFKLILVDRISDVEDYGLPVDEVNGLDFCFAYHPDGLYPVFANLSSSRIWKKDEPETFDTIIGIGARGGALVKNEALFAKLICSR